MGGRDGYLSALAPELRHESVTGVQQFARRRDNHHTRPVSVTAASGTAVIDRSGVTAVSDASPLR
jgi:hypothetical protein